MREYVKVSKCVDVCVFVCRCVSVRVYVWVHVCTCLCLCVREAYRCGVLELTLLLYVVNELTCYIQYSFEIFAVVSVYTPFRGDCWASSVSESKHRPVGAGWHHKVKYMHTFVALAVVCCAACNDIVTVSFSLREQ